MAWDVATQDREVAFRKTAATCIYADDALVQLAFEGPTTVETNLFIKLTGTLAGWKPLDFGSSLIEPPVDLALQKPDGTVLNFYINCPELNKLGGTKRGDNQPATHPGDTISTVKSAWVHTDGDSL